MYERVDACCRARREECVDDVSGIDVDGSCDGARWMREETDAPSGERVSGPERRVDSSHGSCCAWFLELSNASKFLFFHNNFHALAVGVRDFCGHSISPQKANFKKKNPDRSVRVARLSEEEEEDEEEEEEDCT